MRKKLNKKIKILFVCTGNIFRSLSAERALRKHLKLIGDNNFEVSSAGIGVDFRERSYDPIINKLNSIGIDVSDHKQTLLTQEVFDAQDFVVAMDKKHQKFIANKFKAKVDLFNFIANEQNKSVFDVDDIVYYKDPNFIEEKKIHIDNTITHIFTNIEKVYKEIHRKFFLFEDFINGKADHGEGLPFKPIKESKLSVAFMSNLIPLYEDGHVLVIPKRRVKLLENLKSDEKADLIELCSKIGNAFEKKHGGYNIVLNNGIEAGQHIFHVHFHIFPRNAGDEIQPEVMEFKKGLTVKQFLIYNDKIIKALKK